jgi:hypothetical protein
MSTSAESSREICLNFSVLGRTTMGQKRELVSAHIPRLRGQFWNIRNTTYSVFALILNNGTYVTDFIEGGRFILYLTVAYE